MVETTVTIALVTLLLGVGYMFFRSQRVIQDYYLLRQQGLAACMAQLDCLSAGLAPLDEQTVKTCWPRLQVQLQQTPGEGDWEGLILAGVQARAYTHNGREIIVSLNRYVPKPEITP